MYNLKKIRVERGLTQQKLCDELSKVNCYISRCTYTRYETGSRDLPCDILIKLAEYYEVSTDYILGIKK